MTEPKRPARWFLLDDDDVQQGPFPLAAMRERVLAGEITEDTVVWADGMPDWLPTRDVPALTPPASLVGAGPVARPTRPAWTGHGRVRPFERYRSGS